MSSPTDVAERDDYKWRAFGAIGLSFVTVVTSMTMVFVALAPIADHFGITLRAVGWVVIIESLIISALMLPMGRLADVVGRKKVHLTGLALFGIGATLVGFSQTFPMLIGGRVVMAFGNVMTQSVGTAMLVAVFPREERGKAVGAQTTAVSIGAASGPILGGFALQVFSWNVLFLLLVIPVVISIVAGYRLLDEAKVNFGAGAADAKFDTWGALTSGGAVALLVITVSNPFSLPWLSPLIIGGLATVVVAMVAFVRIERRHEAPMLELQLFEIPVFRYGIVARIVGFMGFSFVSLLLPIYLISARGMSTGAAGGVMFLTSFGMGIAAQVAGRLSDVIGARPLTMVGFASTAMAALAFSTVRTDTVMWFMAALVFFAGLGFGTWNVPNNSSILGAVPPSRLGVTGAFTNLTRTIGNVIGQAIASAVVVGLMVSRGFDVPLSEIADSAGATSAFLEGWRIGFFIVVALSCTALVLSWVAGNTRTGTAD